MTQVVNSSDYSDRFLYTFPLNCTQKQQRVRQEQEKFADRQEKGLQIKKDAI